MKKKFILLSALVLIIAWILSNSLLDSASYELSGKVVSSLHHLGITNISEFVLRKLAHVAEYVLLGVLLGCLFKNKQHPWLDAVAVAMVIALSDETLQIFQPERYALIEDIWLDIASAAVGSTLFGKKIDII